MGIKNVLKHYTITYFNLKFQIKKPNAIFSYLGWNFASGVWSGFMVFISAPFLLKTYGFDGFGLVGLWLAMQGVMSVFDFGLSSTLSKAFAQADQASDSNTYGIFFTFERFSWCVSVAFFFVFLLLIEFSDSFISKSSSISESEIYISSFLLIFSLALQFPSILYTGCFLGLQLHIQLGLLQIILNTLRWGGGMLLGFFHFPLHYFFILQAIVSFFQSFIFRFKLVRKIGLPFMGGVNWKLLVNQWRFTIGMAGTASLAALISSADRLILSQTSTVKELGIYSVASLGSNIVQMILLPYYRVYLPRFSNLALLKDTSALRKEYMEASRWLSLVVIPSVVCLISFANEFIFIWTGIANEKAVELMRLILLGVGMSSLSWLSGAVQQANSWTSLHNGMLFLALILGVPIALIGLSHFGIICVTAIWLTHGLISITLEPLLFHKKMFKKDLFEWYATALLLPLVSSVIIVLVSLRILPENMSKFYAILWLFFTGGLSVLASLVSQTFLVRYFKKRFHV